jgi:hypothetical protein
MKKVFALAGAAVGSGIPLIPIVHVGTASNNVTDEPGPRGCPAAPRHEAVREPSPRWRMVFSSDHGI